MNMTPSGQSRTGTPRARSTNTKAKAGRSDGTRASNAARTTTVATTDYNGPRGKSVNKTQRIRPEPGPQNIRGYSTVPASGGGPTRKVGAPVKRMKG